MKRRYQIDQQRAVQEFRQLAREQNPNVQMTFPMTEVVGLLQEGVGHLLREAGLSLMHLVMEEEVRYLAGERHEQHAARRAHRWGKEDGYCVVDGQKVPIHHPFAQSGKSRATTGQLRTVSAQRTAGARCVGQDDAGSVDAQLRRRGKRISRSLWSGEVGGERQLYGGQPGEVAPS
jgi:hypothetical protein